jgi:hypothetical protein
VVGRLGLLTAAEGIAGLIPGFVPENELEARLTADPALLRGLAWGEPRHGHPEGSVANHVADLLDTVDAWSETGRRREELRFLALVHDSLKFAVVSWRLKTGENHHGMRARRFAEGWTTDERLLATLELHDRPYALWRRERRTGRRTPERALDRLAGRIPDTGLFLRFVELDGSTAGKNPAPIAWIRRELSRRSPTGETAAAD